MRPQEPVWVAGRVVCDSDGRLNTKSVLLEGSIRDSGGNRVRLDVSQVSMLSPMSPLLLLLLPSGP